LNLKDTLRYLSENTKKSLYFVNTPECLNLTTSTPCPTIEAANKLTHLGSEKIHINGAESLRTFFPNLARAGNHHLDETLPYGVIYVHTSPCQWAIQTAVDIAIVLEREQLKAVVRVDDRISSSCAQSTADCIVALQSLLAHLDTLEPRPSPIGKYPDRRWLDQRLYSLESEFAATDDSLRMSSTMDIFSDDNFGNPFAGLIIVGEVDFCIPLLQAEPFPWTPRVPREYEIYEITHKGSGYHRKYIGRLAPRLPPVKTVVTSSQRQPLGAPNLNAESSRVQNDKRPASPLASGNGKRALTQSMVSDGGSTASSS
jgi:hypothetical protein